MPGLDESLERLERERQDALAKGDADAAKWVTVRIAWLEELAAAHDLLQERRNRRDQLERELKDAKKDRAEAEATGDAEAIRDAVRRIEEIQALLVFYQED